MRWEWRIRIQVQEGDKYETGCGPTINAHVGYGLGHPIGCLIYVGSTK
ncbi:uncharacterized protein G2W53_043440 [Senna tora]|uniref:Uncharacterized protein n=1 Tax=Senna tora TaxID=362788 RepID=A0A834SVK6_9FABA|nr:uncharacterized protein G2W53_043440 [Senna tora]